MITTARSLPAAPTRTRARGVTLIELAVVIALIAIIAAVAAIAVREPMQSYADTSRRAELSDVADSALRRIGRDVRLALPNSVRVTTVGATKYVELLQVRTGGRYRGQGILGTPAADWLDLTAALGDAAFDVLGAPSSVPGQVIVPNSDMVVVRNESATDTRANAYTYNQSGAGFDCTSATGRNCNNALITGGPTATALAGEFALQIQPRLFNCDSCPATKQGIGSPGNRFYVVSTTSGALTYVCAPDATLDANGDAAGTLTRVSGYTIAFTQPTAFAGATSNLVAKNVSACEIAYDSNALGNNGLVAMRLELTRGSEVVSLYHEVHVNNAP
jgi:MSHA biogenesis protein MshO